MTEPRYCNDCRWFKEYEEADLCERPTNIAPDLVRGRVLYPDAQIERRRTTGGCGPEGKHWQYAASWWQR